MGRILLVLSSRSMDPTNTEAAFDKDVVNYWQNVDLYIGGVETIGSSLVVFSILAQSIV